MPSGLWTSNGRVMVNESKGAFFKDDSCIIDKVKSSLLVSETKISLFVHHCVVFTRIRVVTDAGSRDLPVCTTGT
jgi:archaellum component FlaF (FlaF/FlaG flagellin family)